MKTQKKPLKMRDEIILSLGPALSALVVGMLFYTLIPQFLNYPPNSINNQFQINVAGIEYKNQYIIMIGVVAILLFSITFAIFNRLAKATNVALQKGNVDDINKIRKNSFSYPFIIFIIEMFLPPILIMLGLVIIGTEISLTAKLAILILCISTLIALTSYVFCKYFFRRILLQTAKVSGNNINGVRISLVNKILIQLIPLIVFTAVICYLFTSSQLLKEKGNLLSSSYRQLLETSFKVKEYSSIEEAKEVLKEANINNQEENYYIIDAKTKEIYYSETRLTEFFLEYATTFYDTYNGRTYEYYGSNIEGTGIKIIINGQEVLAGVMYNIFADDFSLYYLIMVFCVLFINTLFLLYVSKSISGDISLVSNNLKEIAKLEQDADLNKELLATSNDEISDLILAFNKIQVLTKENIEKIHDNQEILVEKERLASLRTNDRRNST